VLSVVRKPSRCGSVVPPNQSMHLLTLNQARLALEQVPSIRVFRSKYGHPLPAFYGAFLSHLPLLSPGKTGPASRRFWCKLEKVAARR
jgi:hypothetical protein